MSLCEWEGEGTEGGGGTSVASNWRGLYIQIIDQYPRDHTKNIFVSCSVGGYNDDQLGDGDLSSFFFKYLFYLCRNYMGKKEKKY